MPETHFSSNMPGSLARLPPGGRVHFIGIGGIAMGQIALSTAALGYQVSGSDKEIYDPIAALLRGAQVPFTLGYQVQNIPADTSLVVIGNSVAAGNPEITEAAARSIPYATVSSLTCELVIRDARSLLICGSHGKTTTTAMTSFVLSRLGYDPSYFFGGIGHGSTLGLHCGSGPWSVVEGDEYCESWFARVPKLSRLTAHSCVITSIDHDHIDIYPDQASYLRVFSDLVLRLPPDGFVLCCLDCPTVASQLPVWNANAACKIVTFGAHPHADYKILSRNVSGQHQSVSLQAGSEAAVHLTLSSVGAFNVRNAVAALAACHELAAIPLQLGAEALSHFNPVLRRQEVLYEENRIALIVDFSYHPTAIAETLQGIQESRPGSRILAVHEPASPTSRRAFFHNAYLDAFLKATEVVISKPQPALIDRGHARLDAESLAEALTSSGIPARVCNSADDILQYLLQTVVANDVVVFFTHTAFDNLPERLRTHLATA